MATFFFPFEDELKRVSVWIRVPVLPIEYYYKHILWRIGNGLGRMVKIDLNTLRNKGDPKEEVYTTKRAKFARLCIEVDL